MPHHLLDDDQGHRNEEKSNQGEEKESPALHFHQINQNTDLPAPSQEIAHPDARPGSDSEDPAHHTEYLNLAETEPLGVEDLVTEYHDTCPREQDEDHVGDANSTPAEYRGIIHMILFTISSYNIDMVWMVLMIKIIGIVIEPCMW